MQVSITPLNNTQYVAIAVWHKHRNTTDTTHQLFKVDQVVMKCFIPLVDKGDIYQQGNKSI